MDKVWAVLIGAIVLLIVYGIVSSRRRSAKARRLTREYLPEVPDHIKADRIYRVVLTSGAVFEPVRFVGITHNDPDLQHILPYPLQQWLVLENAAGKRLFVKPNSVRYYEELDEGGTGDPT